MKNYVAVVGALLLGSYSATAGVLKLSELDTDRDGKISRIEANKSPELKMLFDRADANGDGDGYLDRAEFQTAQEWIRQRDRGQTRDQDQGHRPRRH